MSGAETNTMCWSKVGVADAARDDGSFFDDLNSNGGHLMPFMGGW